MTNPFGLHYPASSTENYNRVQRMLAMEVLVCKEYNYFCTKDQFIKVTPGYKRFENKPTQGLLYLEDGFVSYITNDKTLTATIYAETYDLVDEYNKIFSSLQEVKANITWVYSADGASMMVPITDEKTPMGSFYPFLGKSLTDYYDDFMNSRQNILICLGVPGTGKTSFLRGLLQHTQSGAMVSYDPDILNKDGIFANFMDSSDSFFIMEDSDVMLKSRSDGNTTMSKFLNVGDGLVSIPNKKLIFTTNLPSVKDIDSALTRPGRCYDIINFRSLSGVEADIVRKDVGIEKTGASGTLAEVLNERVDTVAKKKTSGFGFY